MRPVEERERVDAERREEPGWPGSHHASIHIEHVDALLDHVARLQALSILLNAHGRPIEHPPE
jgi:hypothetical protein